MEDVAVKTEAHVEERPVASVADEKLRSDNAALVAAARAGDVPLLSHLLRIGANVSEFDEEGFLPSHAAALAGQEEALRLLLSKNLNVHSCTRQNDTCIHLAALSGNDGVLRLTLEACNLMASSTSLSDGNETSCKAELDKAKAALEATNAGGWTALQLSIIGGQVKRASDKRSLSAPRLRCTQMLLQAGAHPGRAVRDGWTALLLASARADVHAVHCLLSSPFAEPTMVHAVTAAGDSPLLLAAHAGSDACVRLLLAAGACWRHVNSRGLGCFTLAVQGAIRYDGDMSDEVTAAFERTILTLAAAAAATDGASRAANGRSEADGSVLGKRPIAPSSAVKSEVDARVKRLPSTPASASSAASSPFQRDASPPRSTLVALATSAPLVPLKRLVCLAAALRRAGACDTEGKGAAKSAAELAKVRGRHALASVLSAPPPARRVLLLLRHPIEAAPPPALCVSEGACAPSVQSEGAALRRALLRSSRRKSDDSGSRAAAAAAAAASAGGFGSNCASAASADSLSAEGSSQDSVAAEREAELAAVAFAEATRLAGGLVRKDRHFSMISTISATDGGEMPPDEALCAALAEWECAHAARTAAVKQIAELGADARSDDGAAELTGYRQANRYEAAGGALEVLTLKAEQSSPILHESHLWLLRLAAVEAEEQETAAAILEEEAAAQQRPWCLYAEDFGASRSQGAHACVKLFSLDAPLVLHHLLQQSGGTSAQDAENGDSEDDCGDDSDGGYECTAR